MSFWNYLEKKFSKHSIENKKTTLMISPSGPAEIRFGFLSRQELERELVERTREIEKTRKLLEEKIKQAESQNKELGENKKALLNLVEDSQTLQDTLKKERDRAGAIITSMGEGLLVMDKDFRIVLINPPAEKLLETTSREALDQKWSEFVTAYKGDVKIPIEERSASRTITKGITVITTPDDDHYYVARSGRKFAIASITTPLVTEGQITGVIKVFRNVTHEKQEKQIIERTVEERTRQFKAEQAKLSASIESLPVGFFIVGSQGKILALNQAAKKIFEVASGKISFDDLCIKMATGVDLKAAVTKSVVERRLIELKEVEFGKKFLRFLFAPIVLENQDIIGSAVLIVDITEEKILDRSKDEFFSIASHELRTPLTAIRGNTSLILDYYKDKLTDQTLKEMIDDIHDSSIRLIQIVNDFLNVSRLEQGRIQFAPQELDFSALVQEVFKELDLVASEKKLALKLDVQGELAKVFADRDRVKEVLINLIGNSIKFTNSGGVKVVALNNDNHLKISVIDTGHGIPLKNQSLLFHKFQQAQEQILTRDFTRGTGLGLYISKLLIEGMGGKIWLENTEEGKGSTFSFTLPIVTKFAVTAQHTPGVGSSKPVANISAGVV